MESWTLSTWLIHNFDDYVKLSTPLMMMMNFIILFTNIYAMFHHHSNFIIPNTRKKSISCSIERKVHHSSDNLWTVSYNFEFEADFCEKTFVAALSRVSQYKVIIKCSRHVDKFLFLVTGPQSQKNTFQRNLRCRLERRSKYAPIASWTFAKHCVPSSWWKSSEWHRL